MMKETTTVIACDSGGTNTSIALMEVSESRARSLYSRAYPTSGISLLEESIGLFLDEAGPGYSPSACCVSAAGIVSSGRCSLTNASLSIDEAALTRALGIPCALVNDFTALTRGVLSLDPEDGKRSLALARGDASALSRPTVLVVGAGTGLGVGFAAYPGARRAEAQAPSIYPSEGGHIALPAYDDLTRRFHAFLQARLGGYPPEAENAVSGPGIANIFEFLVDIKSRDDHPAYHDGHADILALPRDERPSAIAAKARAGEPLCSEVMGIFVELYARSAASLCAATLPRALWIAGGIAAKSPKLLADGDRFMRAFLDHGNPAIRAILSTIPVNVVTDYSISLDGAALLSCELGK